MNTVGDGRGEVGRQLAARDDERRAEVKAGWQERGRVGAAAAVAVGGAGARSGGGSSVATAMR